MYIVNGLNADSCVTSKDLCYSRVAAILMRMRFGAGGPVANVEPIRFCYAIVVRMLVLHDINSRLDARLGVDQL